MEEDEEEPAVRLGNTEREASQSAEDSAAGGLAPSHSGQYDSTGPSTEGQQDHQLILTTLHYIALHRTLRRCFQAPALARSLVIASQSLFLDHQKRNVFGRRNRIAPMHGLPKDFSHVPHRCCPSIASHGNCLLRIMQSQASACTCCDTQVSIAVLHIMSHAATGFSTIVYRSHQICRSAYM